MSDQPAQDEIQRHELERRVLLAALSLAVRLGCRLGISLKDLTSHARVAYLRELRERGLSLAQCAEQLEVSERTAKNLARELRESFELPDTQHTLPTQIEFMLWRTPMSQARLHQVLRHHDRGDIDDALALLLKQQRVRLDHGPSTPVYVPTQSVNSQLSTQWVKRIGGLNSLLGNLYQTICQRFFDGAHDSPQEDARAFARTLSFYASPARLGQLERMFWDQLVPQLAQLDQDSHDDPEALAVKLTLFWASERAGSDEPQTQAPERSGHAEP